MGDRRADQVLKAFREDIVAGRYAPGDRLTEARLCDAYSVSRVPVREAINRLVTEGFLTSVAYAGVRVARPTHDEAVDLFTVRRTIEELTVRRCAERFSAAPTSPGVSEFRARMRNLVETGVAVLGQGEHQDVAHLNTQFHLDLAEFSGNRSLLALLQQISAKIEWLYGMDLPVRGEHSWAEHRAVLEAVEAGKSDQSAALIVQHINNSLEGYLARHSQGGQSASRAQTYDLRRRAR